MSFALKDLVGYAVTAVASTNLAPQAIKVWRTRSANDVSYGMVTMIVISSALWQAHGWLNEDIPLRISSGVTMCFSFTSAFLKLKYTQLKLLQHMKTEIVHAKKMDFIQI